MIKKPLEIYVHIPFCVKKCLYCDFLSFPSDEITRERYVRCLLKEIERVSRNLRNTGVRQSGADCHNEEKNCNSDRQQAADDYQVISVFIGGGTPSVLETCQIRDILCKLTECFDLTGCEEISIEVNPGSFVNAEEALSLYHEYGINRLSIGLQSIHEDELNALGRIHNYHQFEETYLAARQAGFDNINVDLMSAVPKQTFASYCKTLERVTALHPEHISSYSLIVEEGTYFFDHPQILPDEDTERMMYEETDRRLRAAGYHRYEISNYAKEGYECIHNSGYWTGTEYLGVGLGASSYLDGVRTKNCDDLGTYLENENPPYSELIRLSEKDRMEEYMFLGLRMMKGISVNGFLGRFGKTPDEIYGNELKHLETQGLLVKEGDCLRLTKRGIDVSNYVFEQFLIESDR